MFALAVVVVACAGAVMAALTGAGIGSTLVPLFSLRLDFGTAVAAATLPHLVGSAMRALELRRHVDRGLLLRFGALSAVGSLIGAALQSRVGTPVLTAAFAVLLMAAGVLGFLGHSQKWRLTGAGAWIAGAVSGFLGGIAGEQGGLRAVALLGFDLRREAFVATAAAVAVVVDVVRAPVYLASRAHSLAEVWGLIALASASVVGGTWLGSRLRQRVREDVFRRVVSALVCVIGALLLLQLRR
jgi:uncharacterized membrane protein YfcA